jgi:hypothetical protein
MRRFCLYNRGMRSQRGRPPKAKDDRRDIRFQVRLSPAELDLLERVEGEKTSTWARKTLLAAARTATSAPTVKRFRRLVSEWKRQRNEFSSDPAASAMCSAYQKIIAMGPEAIPLVLNELRRKPDHWFWALDMLTNANPIRPEHRGNFCKMVDDWLRWGRKRGFLQD